jgi:hypothetical protein
MTRKKLKWAVLPVTLALAIIGFSSFTEEEEGTGNGWFCKNDPTANTGKCYIWSTGASCDPAWNVSKDCFGVGRD